MLIIWHLTREPECCFSKGNTYDFIFTHFDGTGVGPLVIKMLSLSGIMAGIVLLQSAMPSAVFNYIFADRFNRESDKVAAVILQSTLIMR